MLPVTGIGAPFHQRHVAARVSCGGAPTCLRTLGAPGARRRNGVLSISSGAGNRGIMRKLAGAIASAFTFAVLTGSAVAVNSMLTPGATNPAVTQSNVATTICRPGYTKTVRNVSTLVKHAAYAEYGIAAPRNATT